MYAICVRYVLYVCRYNLFLRVLTVLKHLKACKKVNLGKKFLPQAQPAMNRPSKRRRFV